MKNHFISILTIAVLAAACGSDSQMIDNDSLIDSTGNSKVDSITDSLAQGTVNDEVDSAIYPWAGKDKTVLGYYLNMPGKYLTNNEGYRLLEEPEDTPGNRGWLISHNDSKGDYIKLVSNPDLKVWEGWADLALFHNGGDSVFAFFQYACGPGCDVSYYFLKYDRGRWLNISDSVFTEFSEEQISKRYAELNKGKELDIAAVLYELHPDKGTIDVICDPQFVDGDHVALFTLQLSDGKFSPVR